MLFGCIDYNKTMLFLCGGELESLRVTCIEQTLFPEKCLSALEYLPLGCKGKIQKLKVFLDETIPVISSGISVHRALNFTGEHRGISPLNSAEARNYLSKTTL